MPDAAIIPVNRLLRYEMSALFHVSLNIHHRGFHTQARWKPTISRIKWLECTCAGTVQHTNIQLRGVTQSGVALVQPILVVGTDKSTIHHT